MVLIKTLSFTVLSRKEINLFKKLLQNGRNFIIRVIFKSFVMLNQQDLIGFPMESGDVPH